MNPQSRPVANPIVTSNENMAEFLKSAMADAANDLSCVPRALADIARARSITKLAQDTGMSRAGLHKVMREDGNPSFATVAKMAKALGLKIVLEPLE
jgi:probable addiction module antidote protein